MKIIVDTREQYPWDFANLDVTIVSKKLDTGDYAVVDLEHLLCIERKRNVAELASNITEKRFERELERMSDFPNSFLILEFDFRHIDIFPEGSEIPKKIQKRIKVKGAFIRKRLAEIMLKYKVHVLFCSHTMYAENIAYTLMKNLYNEKFI